MVTEADDKRARSLGYRPVVQNGSVHYCRTEPVVGSHFDHKVCRTPAQITADSDEARRAMANKDVQPMHEGK